MKKILIFLIVVIVIVCIVSGVYINFKAIYRVASEENKLFNIYLNEEINGSIVATLINKAIDNNDKNVNKITIDIKFKDNNKTYSMQRLYKNGINKFVANYGEIKFKCTKIDYDKSTKKIKYLLFEQITS